MDERVKEYQNEADKNDMFLWACARGLLGDAMELVNQGAKRDCKDKKGYYPVHFAACHGHVDILQYLGGKGTDLDAEDAAGRTPLHYAALHNYPEVVKLLAKKGVWLDGFDSDDNSALHLAARQGHSAVVRVLVSSGAKLHLVNKRSLTALGEALVGGHMEVAKLLVEKNADVKERSRRFTLVHLLAGLGQAESLSFVLSNGAVDLVNDVDNPERASPLHAAAMSGSLACVQLLLKHGANPTLADAQGHLPADKLPATKAQTGSTASNMMQLTKLLAPSQKPPALPTGKADTADTAGTAGAAGIAGAAGTAGTAAGRSQPAGAKSGPAQQADQEAGTAGTPSSRFRDKFAALTLWEQIQKVESLARMKPADLRDMNILDKEGYEAIEVVRKTKEALECYQAVVAVHRDEEFQEDASDPEVQEAIEQIRVNNSLEGYTSSEKIMAVLLKLRQLQAVLRAAGGVRLQLTDLLVQDKPEHYQQDEGRLAAMRANLRKGKEMAVQLISGQPLKAAGEGESAEGALAGEGGDGGTAGSRQANSTGPASSSSRGADAGLLEEAQPKQTPWARLFREMGMQMVQSLLITCVVMAVMWFFKLLPWQNDDWMEQQLAARVSQSSPATVMDPAVAAQLGIGHPGGGIPQYPYGQQQRQEL